MDEKKESEKTPEEIAKEINEAHKAAFERWHFKTISKTTVAGETLFWLSICLGMGLDNLIPYLLEKAQESKITFVSPDEFKKTLN